MNLIAQVYKGQLAGGAEVAVKVLADMSSERAQEDFLHEIAVLRACHDPHIVQFLGAVVEPGRDIMLARCPITCACICHITCCCMLTLPALAYERMPTFSCVLASVLLQAFSQAHGSFCRLTCSLTAARMPDRLMCCVTGDRVHAWRGSVCCATNQAASPFDFVV